MQPAQVVSLSSGRKVGYRLNILKTRFFAPFIINKKLHAMHSSISRYLKYPNIFSFSRVMTGKEVMTGSNASIGKDVRIGKKVRIGKDVRIKSSLP